MSIKLEHVDYVYSPGTAYEKKALSDICLEIPHGEFVGIIGHTGSGKSTLTQHLNGLIRATAGTVYYNGEDIYAEGYDMKQLRTQVGLVFQYPEHQLFEVDVLTDVCFGPKNQGLSQEECVKRAQEALRLVGLKEKYWKSSPFELSGGQKRRAAIAGVLAMRPGRPCPGRAHSRAGSKRTGRYPRPDRLASQADGHDGHPCLPQYGGHRQVRGPDHCHE